MTDRASLLDALRNYRSEDDDETRYVARFIELLQHPRCFFRDHLPGHITASSWILNTGGTKVLLVKHATLNKWLQPGGHADGDENVLRTAIREANEETGLTNLKSIGSGILDIDIHLIPARKGFPDHDHYDIRFLFVAREDEPLKISDESTDLRWVELTELEKYNSEKSVVRMRSKTAGRTTLD